MAPTIVSVTEVTEKANPSLEAFNEAYRKATCPIEDEETFLWGDEKDGYHG